MKITQNSMFQNNMFSNTIFVDFLWLRPPKMRSRSNIFWIFFENIDFVKIVLPSRRNANFSRFKHENNQQHHVEVDMFFNIVF